MRRSHSCCCSHTPARAAPGLPREGRFHVSWMGCTATDVPPAIGDDSVPITRSEELRSGRGWPNQDPGVTARESAPDPDASTVCGTDVASELGFLAVEIGA